MVKINRYNLHKQHLFQVLNNFQVWRGPETKKVELSMAIPFQNIQLETFFKLERAAHS